MKLAKGNYVGNYSINYLGIENYLHDVRFSLIRYGVGMNDAGKMCYPLVWYIQTDRAPLDFLHRLIEKKPYLIARQIMKLDGTRSHDGVIEGIQKYVGFTPYNGI